MFLDKKDRGGKGWARLRWSADVAEGIDTAKNYEDPSLSLH